MDPLYPLYPICTFLCTLMVLVPLPWHLFAWNVGTCAYMIWIAISCLNQFINSIAWKDNVNNSSPGWCDISSRIILASSVAVPACSLAITRRLYNISRLSEVMSSRKDKIREMIIDLSLVVGLPIFVLILYYFVQFQRFEIIEEVGCFPATSNSIPAYFLIWMWPLLLGAISMVYCVLTVHAFLKRRRELSQFLNSNNQITSSRYFRLMALAMMDIVVTVPLSIYVIWANTYDNAITPYVSLAFQRETANQVLQVPSAIWRQNEKGVLSLYLDRWLIVVCSVVFFLFFGFAEESRKNYAKLFWTVMRRFGYERAPPRSRASFGISSSIVRTPHLASYPAMYTSDSGLKVHIQKIDEKRVSMVSIGELTASVRLSCDDRKDDDASPTRTASSESLSSPTAGIPRLPRYNPPQIPNRLAVPGSFTDIV